MIGLLKGPVFYGKMDTNRGQRLSVHRVLYQFSAQSEMEMSVNKGDIVFRIGIFYCKAVN